MLELRERVELPLEQQLQLLPLLGLGVTQQLLQRDAASSPVIRRQVDDRHAAAAELLVELVTLGEARTWRGNCHAVRGHILGSLVRAIRASPA